ncbi:PREDICTED: uncharacterized protein LOC104733778 [Camelina sativa]|uniref:Uncharacterized protein LOC104733778 n=1 Tax=Camelina sativa TaxID=90675 RepID=A0ABM0V6I2_CAMSA|nr:PREDICTED: uncharacterized protein LOC104733778 [Camelina sativa]
MGRMIRVKVFRSWRVRDHPNDVSTELILVDEEGTFGHATIPASLNGVPEFNLSEDRTYVIEKFEVKDDREQIQKTKIGYRIFFTEKTIISFARDPIICKSFNNLDFKRIYDNAFHGRWPYDVIGQIVGVRNLDSVKTKGKDNVKLSFDLQDLTGTRLNCTVWGDLAKDFDTQIKEHQDTVVVYVIRFACLKEWKVMSEVDAFRKKLPTDAVDLIQLDDDPSPQKPKVTLYEEFFIMNEKSTMDQIVYSLEARTCVTIATIHSVELLPKWYYSACQICNKKVQQYPPESQTGADLLYICGVCDADVTDVDYKYKLILHVGYGSSQKIKLLLFDGLAQLFIGKKAEELVLEKPKFWDKDDMVVQFGKELYGRNELSNNYSDVDDHKLQIAPADMSLTLSKREHTESNVGSSGGHSMKTRKKIKTEPQN